MIRITDVKIVTDYSFNNVKSLGSWDSVRRTQQSWQSLTQTTTIGRQIKIEVDAREVSWLDVSNEHLTWDAIKTKFTTWLDIKNYK